MSTRPPSRRELAGQRAITAALALVDTARTEPAYGGRLVEHVTAVYADLSRRGDPTGTTARHNRLIAALAFVAATSVEQWTAADPVAAEAFLASLAAHGGRAELLH